jgi:TfoX/Sxy family transcriptional regulator of competence genes
MVEAFRGQPNVTLPADVPQSENAFGSSALKVNNRIFAMLVRGTLVVKLPKPGVDALVASGAGERYDPRHDGRLMKEWVTIDPASDMDWLSLAREALAFVAAAR